MNPENPKNILAVVYSQSGQLKSILEYFLKPFESGPFRVEIATIQPLHDYPFPWNGTEFFDAMPESVRGIPCALAPPVFQRNQYDLIVFAYQPWFLSPSIPAISMLKNDAFQSLIRNTPVVTLIGARNMWITAQEKVKSCLKQAGAVLAGNIVLADRHTNLISAITIQYWLFTGKKKRMLGIFPLPGISLEDIQSAEHFGTLTLNHMRDAKLDSLQDAIIKSRGVKVNHVLMFIESRASRIFEIWAKVIINKKNRKRWLKLFHFYLIIALFILSPVVILLYYFLYRPLNIKKIKANTIRHLSVNFA